MAFIPGLLMLATFGLERVESSLARDRTTDAAVAELVARPVTTETVNTQVRGRASRVIHNHGYSPHERGNGTGRFALDIDGPDLPTREYVQHRPNPEFQPHRHANRV